MLIKLHHRARTAVITALIITLTVCTCITWFPGRMFPSWDSIFSAFGLKCTPDDSSFVRFLDVGQGDCTVIKSGKQVMIVDTGDLSQGETVVSAIRSTGFDSVDRIIITHPHSDHIGGLLTVLDEITVGRIIMSDTPPSDPNDLSIYQRVIERCARLSIPIDRPETDSYDKFGIFRISTLSCNTNASDENDRSVILRINSPGGSFLLMGDAGSGTEIDLINRNRISRCNVLKAGHHGSKDSTSKQFLRYCIPEYVVFCCGDGNRFSHPDEQAVTYAKEAGACILRTDANGDITFYISDDKSGELSPVTEF